MRKSWTKITEQRKKKIKTICKIKKENKLVLRLIKRYETETSKKEGASGGGGEKSLKIEFATVILVKNIESGCIKMALILCEYCQAAKWFFTRRQQYSR